MRYVASPLQLSSLSFSPELVTLPETAPQLVAQTAGSYYGASRQWLSKLRTAHINAILIACSGSGCSNKKTRITRLGVPKTERSRDLHIHLQGIINL